MLRTWKRHIDIFSFITILVSAIVILTISNLIFPLFEPASAAWIHIKTYLLFEYISNSIWLLALTGILSIIIGFTNAYIVTFYEFQYRRLFDWFLILPLAIPSYIVAYVYGDLFSYTGTISQVLRAININTVIDIFSLPGASVIFAFTLYPYIYMPLKSAMKKQSPIYIENAKLLRASPFQILKDIIIPLSRPALVGGTFLVLLETLNDYGVVRYFGVRVFSFAIFDAWFRLSDLQSAIRISAITMVIVITLIVGEKLLRGRRQYHMSVKPTPISPDPLSPKGQVLAYSVMGMTLLIGFIIPVITMLGYFLDTYHILLDIEMLYLVINTLSIAITTTVMIVLIALFLVNFNRFGKQTWKLVLLRITTIGYAIPGAVIAVSVLLLFVGTDRTLYPIYVLFNPETKTLLLTSSLLMLGFAYVIRFQTIGYNMVEASYARLGNTYTEASYTFGKGKIKTLFQVDIPLLKEGLIGAAIIVFIDVIKELPLTLILRPTNYDTLATKVYTYANDEMIQEASGPSLIIVFLCALSIYLLTHRKKG
jgi:iron(III) transport system permease protein